MLRLRHVFLWLWLPASLWGQNTSWGAEADFNYRYLWRGIAYSKGPVFQPAFWVTHRGVTASVWSNMVLNHEPGRGRFDQVFFTVSREFACGGFRIEPAFQGYSWRGLNSEGTANTVEVAGKLSRELGPLRAVAGATFDVASFRRSFIGDAGLEWKHTAGQWRFDASGTTAWANRVFNRTYIGVDRSAMNYVQLAAAATRKSRTGWYVRPHAEIVTILQDPIRRELGYRVVANGGLAFGREF